MNEDKHGMSNDKMWCEILRSKDTLLHNIAARRIETLSAALARINAHRPSYNYHNDTTLPDGVCITTTVDESDYNDLQTYARNALRGVI